MQWLEIILVSSTPISIILHNSRIAEEYLADERNYKEFIVKHMKISIQSYAAILFSLL